MLDKKTTGEGQRRRSITFLFLGTTLLIVSITILTIIQRHHEAEVQAQQQKFGKEILEEALEYIDIKDYSSALDILNKLPSGFPSEQKTKWEISSLKTYLDALITYDPNNLESAQRVLNQLEYIGNKDFCNIADTLSNEVDEFKQEVFEQCNHLMRIEYDGIIPCVGMQEDSLYCTQWGMPLEVIQQGTHSEEFSYSAYYIYKVENKLVCVVYTSYWAGGWEKESSATVSGVYLAYKKSNNHLGFVRIDPDSSGVSSIGIEIHDDIQKYID